MRCCWQRQAQGVRIFWPCSLRVIENGNCKQAVQHKGRAIPLQAWAGPEGSRRLRLPDSKTISTWRW